MLTENSILPLTSKTTPDIINVQNNSESEKIYRQQILMLMGMFDLNLQKCFWRK